MVRYVIYKPANATLDEIWQYSVENWGEQQAETYIEGLFDTLRRLLRGLKPLSLTTTPQTATPPG